MYSHFLKGGIERLTRGLIILAIISFIPISAWSLGNKEGSDFQAVKGLENWNYTYEVADLTKGKYHLLIKGVDKAGNTYYAGPYNVFIDPESDIPIVNISYPTPNLRVGQIINLVGTCVDDDGVKYVEVKFDDGEWVKAEGKEFWSYRFKLDTVPDGIHTLYVRGFDINDTVSLEKSVPFNLDKRAPVNTVTSHSNGVLVSGKFVLEGTVEDKNGVAALYVSYDNRKTFSEVKVTYQKAEDKYYFRLEKETSRDNDGPQILWFKSLDATGSKGYSAFLIFVNNQKPALTILKPTEEETINGLVTISGTARDKIGLKSLTYDLDGTDKGEIKLIPGNPYWSHTIDLRAKKPGLVTINFNLANLTGNIESKKLKVKLDTVMDLPIVTLLYPQPNTSIVGTVDIVGAIQDDDGVKALEYTLDTAGPVTLDSGPTFVFQLKELTPGKHKLPLRASDINEVWGNKIELLFESGAPRPSLQLTEVDTDGTLTPFYPGLLYPAEAQKVKVNGQIKIPNGFKKGTYTLGNGKLGTLSPKAGTDISTLLFDIPLGKDIPAGRIDITVSIEDKTGQMQDYKTFFYKGNKSDEPAIHFVDTRLAADNRLQITENSPLIGFFSGEAIQSAEFVPAVDNLALSFTPENTIRLEKKQDGTSAPAKVLVKTVSGQSYSSAAFVFTTDTTPPELTVTSPAVAVWVKNAVALAGTARDLSGLKQVEYALNNFDNFTTLNIQENAATTTFTANIALTSLADGPNTLIVRATDKAGNLQTVYVPFKKDTQNPVIQLITPQTDDELNGLFTITGKIEDTGFIDNLEFSDNGTQYVSIGKGKDFSYDLNLAKYKQLPEKFYFRITDASQNQTIYNPVFKINPVSDKPIAQIQLPQNGELMTEDFTISGMAFDDDKIQAIYYRLDNREFTKLEGSNNFAIPISLSSISDNQHTIEVKAEDIGGAMSEVVKSNFWVSKSNPESTLDYPMMTEHVKDIIKLKGTSSDPNGIAAVYISFDNGLTFNKAEGTDTWQYRLDTKLLQNGTQSILIKAVDKSGSEGLFNSTINIDNLAPTLSLDTPYDGETFTEKLIIDGKATDNIGLVALSMDVSPLAKSTTGKEPSKTAPAANVLHFNLPLGGVFNQAVEIKELTPGWYNINLKAIDKAENTTYLSRNIQVQEKTLADKIEFVYPTPGYTVSGYFTINGQVISKSPLEKVTLLMDKQTISVIDVNTHQYFHHFLGPEEVKEGDHVFKAQANLPDGTLIESPEITVTYKNEGPWVKIDNFQPGDFVTGRPYLNGSAGYYKPPFPEEKKAEDKIAYEVYLKELKENQVKMISLSFDNGKTFEKISGAAKWQYRLETSFLPTGDLRVLVRAEFANDTFAITKTILHVDTKLPDVTMLTPEEGQRFNDKLDIIGTAGDENDLSTVSIALRKGDKDRYDVPQFIQGLYLDSHFLGNTYWDAGMGLTFLEDNIRLQLQFGRTTDIGRMTGYVLGFKLLANIANIPFSFFFGPSWEFFSMSLAIGANFSYYTNNGSTFTFNEDGKIVSALIAQWEFAKFTIPNWKLFRSFGFYYEAQFWFIPSDISSTPLHPNPLSFGLRISVF